MPNRWQTRLTRLEALRPPVGNDFTPPDLSEAFVAEVWRILWEYGLFASIEAMLEQCAGLTDDASIAAVSDLLAGDTP